QTEDGIRARNVTGVQTCALPISFFRIQAIRLQVALMPSILLLNQERYGRGILNEVYSKTHSQKFKVSNTYDKRRELYPGYGGGISLEDVISLFLLAASQSRV